MTTHLNVYTYRTTHKIQDGIRRDRIDNDTIKIPDVSLSFLKENKCWESFNITHIHRWRRKHVVFYTRIYNAFYRKDFCLWANQNFNQRSGTGMRREIWAVFRDIWQKQSRIVSCFLYLLLRAGSKHCYPIYIDRNGNSSQILLTNRSI